MKKVYFLSTCDTCKRILKEVALPSTYQKQDIKKEALTLEQLTEMKNLAGSYEALFSRRARLYKEKDLKEKTLSESDYKQFLLEHYTFLKRPVFIIDGEIFIGNSKKTIEAVKKAVHE